MIAHKTRYSKEHHALLGPAFRWKLGEEQGQAQRRLPRRELDPWILRAARYLRMLREQSPQSAEKAEPEVAAACRLLENEHAAKVFYIGLLGNLPRLEIAERLGVDGTVLEVAEALFFDLVGFREASGWMNAHIFLPEAQFGSKQRAVELKLAHFGGPAVAQVLLDSQANLPWDEVQKLVEPELLLHTKLKVALEFDLDAGSGLEFTKLYFDYQIELKRLELAREQFQHNVQSASGTPEAGETPEPSNSVKERSEHAAETTEETPAVAPNILFPKHRVA